MVCLSQEKCRTVNFRKLTDKCDIFVDTPGKLGNIFASVGVTVMFVVDGSRIPQTQTPFVCDASCVNQSWIFSSNLLAWWSFDGTFNDQTSTYNGTAVNSPTFYAIGVTNQAVSFNTAMNQYITTSYIPLANTSFTVDAWVYPNGFPNSKDLSIFGLCSVNLTSHCLHLTIRKSGSGFYLYFGFFMNDLQASTPVFLNEWTHVASVFNMITMEQLIYINGVLVGSRITASAFLGTTGNSNIGCIPMLIPYAGLNGFQGYIDRLTVSRRAKSQCEILELATLAARFPFNSASTLVDYGPNSISTTASSYTSLINGKFNEAIGFNGSNSYFQTSVFTPFGMNNQAFTISLWIQPQARSGTLVHLSTSTTGTGAWCLPFIGFSSNGTLVAQISNGTTVLSVNAPSLVPVGEPYWTHVVQTWSSTNGLCLYIDNNLVASRPPATIFSGSGVILNYVTLASSLSGSGTCSAGDIDTIGQYSGGMDEVRIYNRELSAADICALYVG